MRSMGNMLQESFLPLLFVLVGIMLLTLVVDHYAEEDAQKPVVIPLSPGSDQVNLDQVTEQGIIAPDADVLEEPITRLAGRNQSPGRLPEHRENDSVKPSELNAEAIRLVRQGALDQAVERLDRAITAKPKGYLALYNRAVAQARLGRLTQARKDYLQALHWQPHHFESTYNLGLLMLRAGDHNSAVQWLKKAVGLTSGNARARAYFSLGLALAQGGRVGEAQQAYERALEYQPNYLLPRYNQAVLYMAEATSQGFDRARKLLDQIISLKPDFAPAYFLLGRLSSLEGRDEEALGWYDTSVRFQPRFWKARYNQGILALRLGRIKLAHRIFSRLATEFTDRPEAFFNLGRIAYRRRNFQEAKKHYEQAIKLSQGNYFEARLNLGLVQSALGNDQAALDTFDALIRDDLGKAAAMLNRGLVLMRNERLDEARHAFLDAISAKPDYALAFYNLGKLEYELDKFDAAESAYRRAIEIDPGHLKSLLNLGITLAKKGNLEEAVKAYRKVNSIAPSYTAAHFNLGLVLRKLGRLQESATAYQKVLELDEEFRDARKYLGVIYAKLGQRELAIKMFNEILDRDPTRIRIRYNLALQYKKLGRLEEAESEYKRTLRLKPDYARALKGYCSLLLAKNRAAEVISLLGPKADNEEFDPKLQAYLGKAYAALGKLAQAEQILVPAHAKNPRNIAVSKALAKVLYRQGNLDRAIQVLERTQRTKPKSKSIGLMLSRYMRARNEVGK